MSIEDSIAHDRSRYHAELKGNPPLVSGVKTVAYIHRAFSGEARKIEGGAVGVWTDGLMVSTDALWRGECGPGLEPGKRYRVEVSIVEEEANADN